MAIARLSHFVFHAPVLTALVLLAHAGCSSENATTGNTLDGGKDASNDVLTGTGGTGGISNIDIDAGSGAAGAANGGGGTKPAEIITTLPPGFTASANPPDIETPPRGGYLRVGALSSVEDLETDGCANILRGIVRDFYESHPDYGEEKTDGPGFVLNALGDDRKPVHNGSGTPNTEIVQFEDWYHNVDEVNDPYVVDVWLEPVDGTFIFDSGLFFPLDGVGDPSEYYDGHDDQPHNFHFTTELHTAFEYGGGEQFLFRGDDDVWVFINDQLVVDLGGVHGPLEGSVNLDDVAEELELTIGNVYTLDLFHAERRQYGSNFRIETTLDFTECGQILPGDIIR